MKLNYYITLIAISSFITGCGSLYSSQVIRGTVEPTTTETYHAISAEDVHFYSAFPKSYRIIGLIQIENTYSMGLGSIAGFQHSKQAINAKLKEKAASLGANGLIDIHRGEKITTAKAIVTS